MTDIEILEESVLAAADKVADDARDQGTKTLVNLFKSAVLKKYKDVYDEELSKGEVHKYGETNLSPVICGQSRKLLSVR